MNWLWRRDEIDLFEHEYEKLQALAKRPRKLALRQVLQEQEETESKAQVELELALASFDLEELPCPLHGVGEEEDELSDISVDELLESACILDELAARAAAWSRALREALGTKNEEHVELLRVRMNAPLVVAKLTFAAEEETIDDEPALIVADKELELGEIYLGRVLESLQKLGQEERLPQALIQAATKSGKALQKAVKQRRYALHCGHHPGV